MARARARVELDTRRLQQIRRNVPRNTDDLARMMAFDCQGEIVMNFSTESPSRPGQPPGVDTGALKNSIHVTQLSKGTWATSDGVDYGAALEYGTVKMAARPFMLPAFERTVNKFDKNREYTKVILG